MRIQKLLGLMLQAATLLLLLCSLNLAHAGEPSHELMLRIETGMHTANINRIATDAQGRYLVTASSDKTARVWDIASGQLLSTLRPPQENGSEGMLYAVAMSPDGNTVALGGYTGWDWQNSAQIYLFDRASGRLLHRLSGLPNAILDLAWSPDGRWLAAGLAGKNGVRVFRSDTWQQVGSDSDYADASHGVDFSRDGGLVSSSADGFVRLYALNEQGLRLLAKHGTPEGYQPIAVHFSPDGRKIAVGFDDTPKVAILDGSTLDHIFTPDVADDLVGSSASVRWSLDGNTLYAGGSYWGKSNYGIRRWTDGGHSKRQELPGSDSILVGLRPLPDGSLLFGSVGPSWGMLNAKGKRTRWVRSEAIDFREIYQSLWLSLDGMSVGFSFDVRKKSPRFNLQTGFSLGMNTAPGFSRKNAPNLIITNWENSDSTKLNGTPLKLQNGEKSRSVAIAPDNNSFALGTDWLLRLFDSNGAQLWSVPVRAKAVNISADGRYVVAALGDSTIRWYGKSDGKEVLAFFPHADQKRWVVWSPSGYYNASPGGEELIGWHLNQGMDAAADFFPASRFRNQFYRPDVIAKILEAGNETEALLLANAESGRKVTAPIQMQNVLPPVVAVLSPSSDSAVDSTTLKIRYSVRTAADAPVTAMRVRVNGLLQSDTRALKLVRDAGDTQEIEVKLPEQDAEVQLFAENKFSVSTPAILRLKWAGKTAAVKTKPKLYVLAVGVSKYQNPDFNLGLAAKDAQDFVTSLQGQKGKLYSDVSVRLLIDDKASKDDVLDGLDWLKQQVTAQDVGIMFVAGHGMNDKLGGYYFMPYNADPDKLTRTGVSQNDIKQTFASLPGKTVFFVDTCYSGAVMGSVRTSGFINDMASAENGAVVFAASSAGQLSQENSSWGNGAFTKSVVEGLSGSADFRKSGLITAKGLDYYVDDRVKTLTNGQQTPVSISPGGVSDFPIALVGR